ncbi:MAG TPA: WD40 repeat domain-containing protein [Ktedonobacterales bacterium]|nr:WD40 repeat domain-containing protein [Ktedonobacterales bacterium]
MTGSGREDADDAHESHEQERQQRVEALRALSDEGVQPSMAAIVDVDARGTLRNTWRLSILIGLVALVIVGSVTGYLLIARSKQPTNAQKPTAVHAIDLSASKLYCPQAPVWSPDGRQIAIIASDSRCNTQNNSAAAEQSIAIFDVLTGKLQQVIAVKDVLAQHQLVGSVSAIAWSPDGKSLAAFGPMSPIVTTDGVTHQALILYTVTGQQATPRVIIGPPSNIYTSQSRAQVWNVGALSAGPVIDSSLSPALSYHWTADGRIVSDQPLPSDASALTGRSAADGAFTFWQAGYLDALSVLDGRYTTSHVTDTGPAQPTAALFSSSPVVWSPDGQYVVSGIALGGMVAFSTPPTSMLICPSPVLSQEFRCPSQALPQSDAAFAAVVRAATKGEPFTFTDQSGNPKTVQVWPQVPVTWSPSGKYLLTILPGDEERDGAKKTTVTVFDTVTGNPVKQFHQNVGPGVSRCSSPGVLSPTDKQIALLQCSSNSIILWNISDLAA